MSLVPSATETLLALGVVPVACTRFCAQDGITTVGGTKTPDVAAIVALEPDLVVVNDEENRREDADVLMEAGIRLHDMSPRALDQVGPAVGALARAVGVSEPALSIPDRVPTRARAVAMVWRRPWMTQRTDTYGSSVLEWLGFANPFAGAPARYPEVSLESVASAEPDVVVLPSEPYPFGERHLSELRAAVPRARVILVDGRDLFWWGTRTPAALERLANALGPASGDGA